MQGDDEALAAIEKVRACSEWDDTITFASKRARQMAWRSHRRDLKEAVPLIEELGAAGCTDILVELLDHPVCDIRTTVAAALLGQSLPSRRKRRWEPADGPALHRVAVLLDRQPAPTDRWAALACFTI